MKPLPNFIPPTRSPIKRIGWQGFAGLVLALFRANSQSRATGISVKIEVSFPMPWVK